MNSLTGASQATSWRVDWAWSLPLIERSGGAGIDLGAPATPNAVFDRIASPDRDCFVAEPVLGPEQPDPWAPRNDKHNCCHCERSEAISS